MEMPNDASKPSAWFISLSAEGADPLLDVARREEGTAMDSKEKPNF